MPTAVSSLPARPATTQALAQLIAEAAAAQTQVRLVGSRSLSLSRFDADRPLREISTLRLNKILDHAVSDMTVTVQAGISLEALQRALAWHGQWLPIDPPVIAADPPERTAGARTLGGLIATNSLGPLRELAYGTNDFRRLLLGMTWIDGRGTIIKTGGRTVKNVAGYQSQRLMTGACGTLGAIAEVTLRTAAVPPDEQAATFFCPNAAAAAALIAAIRTAPVVPAYLQVAAGLTFAANPLELPSPGPRGLAVTVGFLDRPNGCAAQLELVRNLPAAASVESISHGAAQAGRLRQFLTREPAAAEGFLGFRLHAKSTETCAIVAALGSDKKHWVVAEAGAGVIRAVTRTTASAMQKLATETLSASLLVSQGTQADGGSPQPLWPALKNALDPLSIFGRVP